ncbi:MAG: hypothetical protein LBL93_04150 [Ruminococcus sp.]|jgi:hypothetical protein|nr:hypothetical protein [Ruminococcus sp.]
MEFLNNLSTTQIIIGSAVLLVLLIIIISASSSNKKKKQQSKNTKSSTTSAQRTNLSAKTRDKRVNVEYLKLSNCNCKYLYAYYTIALDNKINLQLVNVGNIITCRNHKNSVASETSSYVEKMYVSEALKEYTNIISKAHNAKVTDDEMGLVLRAVYHYFRQTFNTSSISKDEYKSCCNQINAHVAGLNNKYKGLYNFT